MGKKRGKDSFGCRGWKNRFYAINYTREQNVDVSYLHYRKGRSFKKTTKFLSWRKQHKEGDGFFVLPEIRNISYNIDTEVFSVVDDQYKPDKSGNAGRRIWYIKKAKNDPDSNFVAHLMRHYGEQAWQQMKTRSRNVRRLA